MEGYYDNPGILLNSLVNDEEEIDLIEEFDWIQQKLKSINLELRGQNDNQIEFIGAHPISLSKAKLQEIKTKFERDDWLVCEKTDGVRFLLIILNNGHCYFTGRNFGATDRINAYQLHQVRIKVPSQLIKQNSQNLDIIEMFDGELIIDHFSNNISKLNFLIFDTLIHNYVNCCRLNYFDRLRCAQEYQGLYKVLKKLAPLQTIENNALNHFPKIKCILKDFFSLNQVKFILNNYISLLPHGNDGLIFTKNTYPYKSGTNQFIVKWKPPEKNTIDFLIAPNTKIKLTDSNFGVLELYIFVSNSKKEKTLILFDFIYVEASIINDIKQEINKQYDKLEEQGAFGAIRGIVAECKLQKLTERQEKMAKLFDNQSRGYENDKIESFFKLLLRMTELAYNLDQQVELQQIDLMHEVRENIHLKYNFKYTWVIEKYRNDKSFPNSLLVAKNLIQIISEDLKEQELIDMLELNQQ